jgi:predicted house-cleaning NTP pyrophosphatase (Maf/HAM1 superfamily)
MRVTLVLASSSPRRREMIRSLGIEFEIVKPEIDEAIHDGENPFDYVKRISAEKAAAVAAKLQNQNAADSLILAADTIVLAADTIGVQHRDAEGDGEGDQDESHYIVLSKPKDAQDAREMLMRLRERPHMVYTAFRLMKIDTHTDEFGSFTMQFVDDLVGTEVTMRDYSDDEIEAYIASGDPFDKAGSYAIQNEDFRPVLKIDGCYNNVVGLPLCAVKRALAKLGWYGFGVTDECDCPPYSSPEVEGDDDLMP